MLRNSSFESQTVRGERSENATTLKLEQSGFEEQ
jgi:hypothetical protein